MFVRFRRQGNRLQVSLIENRRVGGKVVAEHIGALGSVNAAVLVRERLAFWVKVPERLQPFGGRRWWWICPRTGRRATKLYLPNGALTFASRQAYRLAYRCQRETNYDRALRRAFKLRDRLGADGGIGDYVAKPKWMRIKTYDRKLEEIWQAEGVVDAHLAALLGKLHHSAGAHEEIAERTKDDDPAYNPTEMPSDPYWAGAPGRRARCPGPDRRSVPCRN
jgi:hypothetical protein